MNAITFAEAGEHETAKEFILESGQQTAAEAEKKQEQVSLAEKAQKYMEAAAFAEHGEHEYAREALGEAAPERARAKSILVLGNEDTFAEYLMDYAVDMAQRFDYEIIAVNTLAINRRARIFSGLADEIGERFRESAQKAGEAFRQKAEEKGIPFRQEIMLMSEQKAIKALHEQIGNIEFVLTEPEPVSDEAGECDQAVCVCSLVT
jgi:hypothetical protein